MLVTSVVARVAAGLTVKDYLCLTFNAPLSVTTSAPDTSIASNSGSRPTLIVERDAVVGFGMQLVLLAIHNRPKVVACGLSNNQWLFDIQRFFPPLKLFGISIYISVKIRKDLK